MRLPTRKAERERRETESVDNFLTKHKLQRLQKELADLKTNQLPAAIQEMQRAAEDGDFSENFGYQDAKRRVRHIHTRILLLTERIAQAVVIESGGNDGIVRVGSTVTVASNKGKTTFTIVGAQEVDIARRRISHSSPVGSAIIGHKVGDEVAVTMGQDITRYTILDVKPM